MTIKAVITKDDWKDFHRVPHRVYRHDSNWICPLEGDVEAIFDPAKNKTLAHGEAQPFVLLDEQRKPAGRLAAFVDEEYSSQQRYPTGGMGYFECIDNDDYAAALFETAEKWVKDRGMKAIDGPVHFGGRDKYYGLLVKGFDPPLFQENYQPRYYQRFFDHQDYLPFEQILTMKGVPHEVNLKRMGAVVERMQSRYEVRVEAYDPKKLQTYAEDFCTIYNAAFRHFAHFKPITPETIVKTMKEAKYIADPDLLCIAYFEDQPAGFCAFFPDINPALKPVNGRLSWWKTPAFLWRLKTAKSMECKGVGFGIHPDYKTKGIFAFIAYYMAKPRVLDFYRNMYLTTVRAHNTEAVRIYLKLGVDIDRVHIAYRKALEEGVEIEPHEFMEV